ncbi:MAG: helix-turn-helix domain-containing protein [Oscillospiraceae bacterium]|nr:helix-turn-helix domain-containing protein [Oscillospiraceae bacterium]MDE7279039.1 helix-turn-helix domain-containing protein [Oscillospiraceae bacterium]
MTILERILQLREERGWTEYRLSEESGIAQSTISSWFRKNVNPSKVSLEKICKAFNITMSQFFAFNNDPVDLTDKQRQVLENWNKLNSKQQDIILELLMSMLP